MPPPTCIWRMKKIQTPISSSIGRPLHERDHVPGLGVLRPRLDLDALVAQHADQVGVLRREGLEAVAGLAALRLVAARGCSGPGSATSATRPSSTACMKRVKLISGARGCCLVTMDHRISPIRSSSSQSPRFRETGFNDTSTESRITYHVDFPWAMRGRLVGAR